MGENQSKPEFITVLGDKQVKMGKEISLSCVTNTEGLTVTWEKDGHKLVCVQDKHIMKQDGTNCSLQILNADETDEGNYTIKLENTGDSCSAMVIVELKEWRTVQWKQDAMVSSVKEFKIANDQVRQLRFLLYGPVGAGKSSIMNTIRTIFEDRQFVDSPVTPHTKIYEKYGVGREGLLPLAFNDLMGVEKGESAVHTGDVINALKGHIKEGYVFDPTFQISEQHTHYRKNPSLSDRIHCLVSVFAADSIEIADETFIEKMKTVGEAAKIMGIPQVVLMTKVDLVCPLTKQNLQHIYRSKKIKEKMEKCSNLLGVPVNCIFPVKNYNIETHVNEDINCLMLDALTHIVPWAHDYVVKCSTKLTHTK